MTKMMAALFGSTALLMVPAIAQTQQGTSGQQPSMQQQQQRQGQQQQQRGQQQQLSAQEFARQAALSNLIEVETGQLALDRARNQQVRDLAQRLINEHRQAMQQLQSAAQGLNVPTQIRGEYDRVLRNLRQAGNQFDQEYIDFQIRAHEDTIEIFQQFSQSGDNRQLQQYAQQMLPNLRNHLRQIEQLESQVGGQASRQQQQQRTGQQQDRPQQQRFTQQQDRQQRSVEVERERTEGARRAQVFVTQQPPEVTVDQPQPRITVRQQPPRITIEQPQPEIIVRMPDPTVDVSANRPQVEVRMPEPRVTVNREGREQVRINRAQQPQVTYERVGQPQVQYRQAEGQPQVRYERAGDMRDQRQATGQTSGRRMDRDTERTGSIGRQSSTQPDTGVLVTGQQRSRGAQATNEQGAVWVTEAQRIVGDDGASADTGGMSRQIFVGDLLNSTIYNARGQELGEIEQVIVNTADNRRYVVLSGGGFLGLFEDEAALPVSRLRYENGRYIVRGLTEEDIEQMPDWERRMPNYRELSDNDSLELTTSG